MSLLPVLGRVSTFHQNENFHQSVRPAVIPPRKPLLTQLYLDQVELSCPVFSQGQAPLPSVSSVLHLHTLLLISSKLFAFQLEFNTPRKILCTCYLVVVKQVKKKKNLQSFISSQGLNFMYPHVINHIFKNLIVLRQLYQPFFIQQLNYGR